MIRKNFYSLFGSIVIRIGYVKCLDKQIITQNVNPINDANHDDKDSDEDNESSSEHSPLPKQIQEEFD